MWFLMTIYENVGFYKVLAPFIFTLYMNVPLLHVALRENRLRTVYFTDEPPLSLIRQICKSCPPPQANVCDF